MTSFRYTSHDATGVSNVPKIWDQSGNTTAGGVKKLVAYSSGTVTDANIGVDFNTPLRFEKGVTVDAIGLVGAYGYFQFSGYLV